MHDGNARPKIYNLQDRPSLSSDIMRRISLRDARQERSVAGQHTIGSAISAGHFPFFFPFACERSDPATDFSSAVDFLLLSSLAAFGATFLLVVVGVSSHRLRLKEPHVPDSQRPDPIGVSSPQFFSNRLRPKMRLTIATAETPVLSELTRPNDR